MKGIVVLFFVIAGLAVGAAVTLRDGYGTTVIATLKSLVGGDKTGYSTKQFEVDLVDQINYARVSSKLPAAKLDDEMQTWLVSHAGSLNEDKLNDVTKTIRDANPRYRKVVVCFAGSLTLSMLGQQFTTYVQHVDAECNSVAVLARPKTSHLGYEAFLVIGNRLDDFSPEALNEHKTELFYSVCLHCGHGEPYHISAAQRGIELECAQCGRTYAVLAADENGKFRYVNEFLTGYQPPTKYLQSAERLDEMYTIWRTVVAHCSYQKDSNDTSHRRDSWQTALETQCIQHGDCEDSSIFLADWLLARGFQVRVALGHYGDIGEHAWCVVRLDGVDYLLESTEGPPNPGNPPYVSDVGSRYAPKTLFDRDTIYVRSHPKELPTSVNYWSPQFWTPVKPRTMFQQPSNKGLANAVKAAVNGQLPFTSPPGVNTGLRPSASNGRVAITPLPGFSSLNDIRADGRAWEVIMPLSPFLSHK
jgi:hypothetical protein